MAKVDLIIRKLHGKQPIYREIQVKYGKLHVLFDVSTWQFFKLGEFDDYKHRKDVFLIYVMSEVVGDDDDERWQIFVFPIAVFCELIEKAITVNSKKHGTKPKMYISRSLVGKDRWYLRMSGEQMTAIAENNCFEVSNYQRAFKLLD